MSVLLPNVKPSYHLFTLPRFSVIPISSSASKTSFSVKPKLSAYSSDVVVITFRLFRSENAHVQSLPESSGAGDQCHIIIIFPPLFNKISFIYIKALISPYFFKTLIPNGNSGFHKLCRLLSDGVRFYIQILSHCLLHIKGTVSVKDQNFFYFPVSGIRRPSSENHFTIQRFKFIYLVGGLFLWHREKLKYAG